VHVTGPRESVELLSWPGSAMSRSGVRTSRTPASRRFADLVVSGGRQVSRKRPLVGSSHRAPGPGDRRGHRSFAQVASRARGESARNQVFVRGAPHRAR